MSVEQVWIVVEFANHKLYLCVVYFPPDRVRDICLIEAHCDSVQAVVSIANPEDEILILGDYNLPSLKWRPSQSGFLYPDPDQSTFSATIQRLLDCYSTATLKQINNTTNENDRTLDLCFISARDHAPSIDTALSPLVKVVPHHPPLHVTLERRSIPSLMNSPASVSYNFNTADYDSIFSVLSTIDWDSVLDKDDVDAASQTFSHILGYVIDRHVPKRVCASFANQPWQSHELRRLKTAKRAALRKFSKHRSLPLGNFYRQNYRMINHRYRALSRQCYSNYQRVLQQKLKTKPKSFWKFVNEQRKESGLPSAMQWHGENGSNEEDICRFFAAKFSSIFSDERLQPHQIVSAAANVPTLGQSLMNIDVNNSMIERAASKLKSSCSSGPDGIPSIFLKKCLHELLAPLRHIFDLSLSSGKFPSLWKNANMFPVYKKGDRKNVDNYRGISALCAVSKLFELVVLEPVFSHCKPYISEEQHGFMPKRSTTTNLLSFTSFVTDGFAQGEQTDAIYTDLSAAFDTINHEITMAKLERLGIDGTLLRWFHSYLTDRHICVKVGDRLSTAFPATSGIPQGSHLGPMIFALYFNDVNLVLGGPRLSFADDLKLFSRITKLSDASYLQQQLQTFSDWCELNRMVLNIDKCSVISFTRKQNSIIFDYRLGGIPIARENHVKDLGIILDNKLTFKQHVSFIVDKASRNLGFIFRMAKGFTDIYCLKALYCSLVRSTLEYGSAVWNPHYQNGIGRIEAVQHRFIRFALRSLPWRDPFQLPRYEDRCQLINLDTLSVRRNMLNALLISDVLTSRIDCPTILSQINLRAPSRTLRGNLLLRIPFRRANYSAYGALTGLQRLFNRVSSVFDFHLSRYSLKKMFLAIFRQ